MNLYHLEVTGGNYSYVWLQKGGDYKIILLKPDKGCWEKVTHDWWIHKTPPNINPITYEELFILTL